MKQSWENWAEWTPVDLDQEEGQQPQAPAQEEPRPEDQQPVMENPTTCVGLLIKDIVGCHTSIYTRIRCEGYLHSSAAHSNTNKSIDSRLCMFKTCDAITKRSDKNGAKALFSKMAPKAPKGQFRRFHRKSILFAFGHLKARIRSHSAISGEAPA